MRVGPNIWSELQAAGLSGLPLSVEGGELVIDRSFPDDKRAALSAVLAAHNAATQPTRPSSAPQAVALLEALIAEGGIIPANKVAALRARLADL